MSAGSFVTGNMQYIRAPFVANIKPGHRVLILSDFSHDPRVWQIVQATCAELGAETTVALFERRPADYYDPPSAVCEAMMKSDFNVLLASTGMLHSHASFTAMAAGIPSICMDGGMTLEWFQSGAVTDDMKQIAVRKHYVAKRVFGPNARECRVTSRYGTDFTYSVANRITQPPLPGAELRSLQDHQLRQGREPAGQQPALLSVPDRRVQRRAGRGLGQRQAGDRPHHASHRPAAHADRADGEERPRHRHRRRPRGAHPARLPRRVRRRERLHVPGRGLGRRQRQGGGARHPARGQEHHGHACTSGSAPTSTSAARSSRRSTWTA